MSESKEKTAGKAVQEDKQSKKEKMKTPVMETEPEYDVETLCASGLFLSKSIVRAAMRCAGKQKATIGEALELVKQF